MKMKRNILGGLAVLLAAALLLAGPALAGAPQAGKAAPLAQQPTLPARLYFPLVLKSAEYLTEPPPYSTSYYMKTVDPSISYNMGCAVGKEHLAAPGRQDQVVVLDYGYTKDVNGVFGASLFGFGPVSTAQIAAAVESYAMGYYICTGEDFSSNLVVAVGTNNYPGAYNPSVTYAHGQAWALMVNQINDWILQKGYFAQVQAVGANDIELSWNYPGPTIDWVNGYDAANQYDLYNFGAIPGCPYIASPNAQCGTYPYLWTREQVWYVSFGSRPIYPLPEIYLTNGVNAQQWYLMSVYSVTAHGLPMDFKGVMTTYQACLQRGGCSGIDNPPASGWNQLNNILKGDPRTVQILRWSTDIKWYGE